jgi:hypothetical protein
MAPINKTKEEMFHQIFLFLGGSSIEVELESEDYDVSLDEALRQYRAHSQNSVSFKWVFVNMEPGTQNYTLPDDIDEVLELRRLRSGLLVGQPYEPFSVAFLQSTFGSMGTLGGAGDLVTFEAMAEFQELLGRMFGEFIPYTFNKRNKNLYVHRMPRGREVLGVECSGTKPLDELLNDTTSYRWIRSYTEAMVRGILAEKYTKTQVIPGAQGATTLKGTQLLEQAKTMKLDLIKEIQENEEGNEPPIPFFG